MSIVDKLLEAEGAIQSEVRVPDLDRLLHEAASEIETIAAVNAELVEALEKLVEECVDFAAYCSEPPNVWALRAARAAIAKARGTDNA